MERAVCRRGLCADAVDVDEPIPEIVTLRSSCSTSLTVTPRPPKPTAALPVDADTGRRMSTLRPNYANREREKESEMERERGREKK